MKWRSAAVALVLVLGLGACGSETVRESGPDGSPERSTQPAGSESPSAAPSTSPSVRSATGELVEDDAFSVRLPKGWSLLESTRRMPVRAVDTRMDDTPPTLVVQRRGSAEDADAAVVRATEELDELQARQVRRLDDVSVDGVTATRLRALRRASGMPLRMDRFDMVVDGTHLAVTFTTNRWMVPERRQRMIESVLASWTWQE